jgi:hypothetical protein
MFRAWLFRLIFGFSPAQLKKSIDNYALVIKTLQEHQDYLNSLEASLITLSKQTPATGWSEVIQEAIMNLSQKIEYHREVLQAHQDNISELSEMEVIAMPEMDSKKDWN